MPVDRKEYDSQYRKKNYERDKEKNKEYQKQYRIDNKENSQKYYEEYRENNKEKIKERNRLYYIKNKEKINSRNKEYFEEYRKTEVYKKMAKISSWKCQGLISDNYDEIYERYLNSKNCEECNCEYSIHGDGVGRFKVMDHNHDTGKFRNVLCHPCNVIRG